MTSVRPAHHTDFEAVAELMAGFMAQHHRWQPDQFRRGLLGFTAAIFQTWLAERDDLNLVAEGDGRVVGYALAARWRGSSSAFTYPRRAAFIEIIVVAGDQRRKGTGTALFQAVERWATEFNAEFIGLNVSPQNDAAKSFYTALGYDLYSEYRVKTLRHIKRLSDPE